MQLVHSQCSIALHEPYLRLIERLIPVMPDPSLDSFFFWNSGSEAVEAAIKMARWFTKKQNIICMQGPSVSPLSVLSLYCTVHPVDTRVYAQGHITDALSAPWL